jgi:hypothetical protein
MLLINLDLGELNDLLLTLEPQAKAAMKQWGQKLVANTRAHIVEEAHKKLRSRRAMFVKHLTHKQISEDTFVVSLAAQYRWIDDGMLPHNMIEDLLKSKSAKMAANGSKYVVVPFEHGPQGPAEMTPAEATLLNTIKSELRKQTNKFTGKKGIPYAKLETDASGAPRLGLLHSFDINSAPTKTIGPWGGWGQGKGAVGSPMVGPTGIPLLQGVSIYQKEMEDATTGKKKIKRAILTFRVASSKHQGQGRWEHPGLEKKNLMEEGAEWAKNEWEKNIAPALVEELISNL